MKELRHLKRPIDDFQQLSWRGVSLYLSTVQQPHTAFVGPIFCIFACSKAKDLTTDHVYARKKKLMEIFVITFHYINPARTNDLVASIKPHTGQNIMGRPGAYTKHKNRIHGFY